MALIPYRFNIAFISSLFAEGLNINASDLKKSVRNKCIELFICQESIKQLEIYTIFYYNIFIYFCFLRM